jgi:hypothetical protein
MVFSGPDNELDELRIPEWMSSSGLTRLEGWLVLWRCGNKEGWIGNNKLVESRCDSALVVVVVR